MANQIQHSLKPGTILASSWGYDQTNWDFYKVVKATARMVYLVKMDTIKDEDPIAMRGTVRPNTNVNGKEVLGRFKVQSWHDGSCDYVRIEDYELAKPWDGQPKKFTSYC